MSELHLSQKEIYFDQVVDLENTQYNIGTYVVIKGNLDVGLFKESVISSERVFDVFKFKRFSGYSPSVEIQESPSVIQITDLDFTVEEYAEEAVKQTLRDRVNRPFDILAGRLYDFALIKRKENEYWFYVGCHHLFSDGYGVPYVFLSYIFDKYHALRTGVEREFLYPSYLQLIEKSNEYLDSNSYESDKNYWKQRFKAPQDRIFQKRLNPASFRTDSTQLFFSIKEQKKIRSFCLKNDLSLQDFLIAILTVYYKKTSGVDSFDFSLPIHNRSDRKERQTLGVFSKLMPCRIEVGNPTLNELFKIIKTNQRQDYRHKQFPVSHFNRMIETDDNNSSRPFDICVNYRYFKLNTAETELDLKGFRNDATFSKTLIEYSWSDFSEKDHENLFLEIIFREDYFAKSEIELLGQRILLIIDQFYNAIDNKIDIIDVIPKNERRQLISTFNDTKISYPKNKTIVDLFEEQVARTPNNTAVIFEENKLTYEALNEQANQLALYLQQNYNIQPDDLVGIRQDRSEWMIISILGVLKAGAAYVPIDPEYPLDRISYIEKDAQCKVYLDEDELSRFKKNQVNYSKKKIVPSAGSGNLAYVIYTSGSTGRPKGVMIEHRAIVNTLLSQIEIFNINSRNTGLQFASFSFDASVSEVFIILLSGASLSIINGYDRNDPQLLTAFINTHQIDIATLPPSYLNKIDLNELKGLKKLITAGESAVYEKAIEYLEFGTYYNAYGPTEVSICGSIFKFENRNPASFHSLPIGKPLFNTQIYILSEENELQPIGIVGEICIGGAGLARGYLNQEELTKEKFIESPFKSGARIYKTGDLGRWLPDGNIEFIGRKDDQVKIRGYRIELEEVAHALRTHKEIEGVVVLSKENQNKEKELVAYITAKTEQNINGLRSYLKKILPEYMLPAYYVQLEALPLTSNGKIDKKSLPDPQGLGLASGVEYIAPRNELEQDLVKIWENILQREHIGIKDDFFALGGHSLKAVRLSNEYQKALSVKLSLKHLFIHTNIASHAELIRSSKKSEFNQIEKVALQESYPLSDAQRRLWVLSQFEDGSIAYNMPGSVKLEGKYELSVFQRSFDGLMDRHEILRTVFREDGSGDVKQWILKKEDLNFKIDYQDYRKEENKEEKIKGYLVADSYKVFDLEQGPLLRAGLLQVEDECYIFYFNMHHIICDGWSMEILAREVFSYYDAYKENREPTLKELRIQYKDYSAWALAQVEEESSTVHRNYWLNNLKGELPLLDFPSTKQRPIIKSNNGQAFSTYIDSAATSKLKKYSEDNDGSLFMGLLTVWNVLLYHYTSQKDIIIGSPVAGRDHRDLEDQIGFYINTLIFRNEINPEENVGELFSRIKETTLNAYLHQQYPFDRLVEELNLQRDTSRSAVFDILFTLQNNVEWRDEIAPMTMGSNQIVDKGFRASKFDLEMGIQEFGNYLSLEVVYNTDVYDRKTIEGLITHYKQLLNALLEKPEEKISQLDYLLQDEKHKLFVTFNNTVVDYPKEKTIVDLFEEQVAKTPDHIAVVFEEKELTYRGLNEKANQLAHYLLDLNQLGKGDFINVNIKRSEYLIITLLGILKSGFAYVLLDPSLPEERLNFILNDSGSNMLINDEFIDHFQKTGSSLSKEKRAVSIKPDDVVYLMYTSGSTGNPKGAINIHRGFTNTVRWYAEEIKIAEFDRIGIISNLSFDLTQKNYFAPLTVGAAVYIDSEFNPEHTSKFIKKHKISIINCAPTMFYSLLDENQEYLISLKKVILGGESINFSSIKNFLETNDVKIFNSYGPSEASDVSIYHQLVKGQTNIIPIGKPIRNTTVFIVNSQLKPVPIGVAGEICIGGIGLGLGYLNQKELTDKKFVHTDEWGKIYRTGDIGRYNFQGEIEFIGRVDNQVKIRGHRVELEEIETKIQHFEEIIKQVCVEVKTIKNEQILVAYIVVYSSFDRSELKKELRKKLPEYMIPTYFVELSKLPLTSNGKIDRKSLPDPQSSGMLMEAEYLAPRNALEAQLVKIWEEVLQRDNIGIQDDFFSLGGHSLKALRVSNAYQKALSVKLSLKDLFTYTSIASHVELIHSATKTEFVRIEKVAPQESYAISDAQRRLWVLSQFEDGSVAYNMPGSITLEGKYELSTFQRSFDRLIDRHEIIRTVFKEDQSGDIKQWILQGKELGFKIDYRNFKKEKNKQAKVQSYIQEDAHRAFDLEKGPLLRAGLLWIAEERYIFYFNMHHIISDGWSMDVLTRDVLALYNAYRENKEPDPVAIGLKELRIQYKDYSAWQLHQFKKKSFKAHRAYWLERLGGELPLIDLPSTKRRPRIKTYNGRTLSTYIAAHTSSKLKSYSEVNGGSLFMGLLASWSILMYRYTSQKDIIIGTPVAGRDHGDLEDQIGFYVNTLALRNEINAEESFNEYYSTLKASTLKSYDHQLYPFDRLVEELNIQRDTSRSAVFDVLLTLQNNGEKLEAIELKEEALTQIIDKGFSASKFDLELSIQEIGDYLSLEVVYNTDVYERTMIEGLIRHYKQLLKALLENPEQRISQIDYLSQWEKHELQISFNDTKAAYPKEKTIIDLFEEQVSKTPDSIALIVEDKEVTYRELDDQSNQLAYYLQKNYSIQGDDLIGILLERTEWMIISILGVLKSGGAYVPIDPEYPQERIDYIQKDTDCKVCIDENELRKFEKSKTTYSKEKINFKIKADDLAYVIYTSGSTGNPKGVMISHGNANSFIHWSIEEFKESDFDVVFGVTSICFDLSVFEIFYSLSVGKPLRLLKDGLSIPDYLNSSSRVLLNTVPSIVGNLLSHGIDWSSVGVLNMAGEPIPDRYLQELPFEQMEVRNLYGPSEDTTYSTVYRLSPDSGILIGHPISNTEIYIVNESDGLQGIGVAGEICISGDGLARGYWNKAELTAERFVANPFRKNSRMYRTGDIGRWLPNGNIEYIGRKDDQVKIRGYRIELGEIAHALRGHQEIEDAVVVSKENQNSEKELVAYIISKTQQNTNELRSYLKESLPEFMLPAYYVQLEALPLTSNGKIDKKSLPDPKGLGLASGVEYIAPRNELEQDLVKIWENILQREHIGIKNDFFELGGHSLKAVRLSNEYQKALSVKLSLKDLFIHTSIASHAELIRSSKKSEFNQIEKVALQESYPLSDAQRRLWVLSQFEDGSVAYNMPGSVKLEGKYELSVFQRSFDRLMDRHEILRTVFREDGSGEARQWILKTEALGFKIDYKDYRKEQNKEEKIQEYLAADSYKTFDLEQGPLLRAGLLQVEDECYVFYYNMHHIISDGWSMEVLTKDVFSYYEAYKENREPVLKDLRIQYRDYSVWALAQLKEESFNAHRTFWLNSLSGELPLIDLPSTKQRPRIKSSNGQALSTYIDAHTSSKLKNYSEANGGSLFMGLLAAWNILMYRYTSQKDIIIGTPVAGRDHGDLEDQIGFYVNTLALRNEINGEEDFNGFFSSLKNNTLKSYSHQMYPFDRLVEELDLQRDTSRSAVFDVLLTLQNNGEKREVSDPMTIGLKKEKLNQITDLGHCKSKFDISITFHEVGDYLSLHIVYNMDVYDQKMIEGLIKHYKQLLNALLEKPEEKISQVDYMSQEEKHELVVTFNDTAVDYPKDKTIVDLFEEQVAKTPNSIAVVFEEKELTYQELNEQSNQLAHYLQKKYKIEPDDLVGIKLDRSEWMIVSVFGILKAGGAYVPIDPEYPQDRIDYIEKDTACKVCIDENELSKFRKNQKKYSKEKPGSLVKSNDLAYVIYTSGTTGQPKGVMIEHGNLVSFMSNVGSKFRLDRVKKIAGSTNLTFDISLLEIFGSLCNGKELILFSKDEYNDPHKFLEKIEQSEVDGLQLTPSRLSQLYSACTSLPKKISFVLIGGEALSELLYETLKKEPFESINVYGPTETTIWSTCLNISASESLSIGKPLLNEQVYILSEEGELQPIGVTGKIYIKGAGVARGYLNREELTKEKFISNPYKKRERLYNTGDLGRWLPDGNIEFVGRKDDQVKIRGYRIELGEIEHALIRNEQIEEAVVLIRENQNKEKELVAYITSREEQNTGELRSYLKEILPAYMLPAYYVQLETLPLTANGKVDRKSLPDPEGLGLSSGVEYVAPRNEIEQKLVNIWSKVLRRENISVTDDFFVLGGHSLKALRLSNEYQQEFSVKLSLKDLFIHTSIASHVDLIRSTRTTKFVRIEKAASQKSYALSDSQRRLWVLGQFEGGSMAYNMPGSIVLEGSYELYLFQKSFDSLIDRHEILRTVFKEDHSGEIRQWVVDGKDLDFKIDYQDFRKEKNKQANVLSYIQEDSFKAFDFEQGPLLRAGLLQIEDEHYIFYFNMHHIISDGWSMEVLKKDVLAYYEYYKEEKEPDHVAIGLKELRIQYKDYSAWQLAQLEEESFKVHRAYWLERLHGTLPLLDLPSKKQRPKLKTHNGHTLRAYIDSPAANKLKKYSEANGGSLFIGLLAAWNILMFRYTSQNDIIIGSPIAGREHSDLEDQIGFYVNTVALRNDIKPEENFDELFSRIKQTTLQAYAHQMYPFDRLVEELGLARDTGRSAVFDVMLVLQNNGEKAEGIDSRGFGSNKIEDLGHCTSKFDMDITFQEVGDYLSMQVEYNSDVYDREMAEGLIHHYRQLINALLDNPKEGISQLDYLSAEEKYKQLVTFNDTVVDYPKGKTIIDIFEAQVTKTPDHVAVVFEDKELTYRELNEQSNQLAHYLRKNYTILPEDFIGIKLGRTEWMFISILGVLKSGGAYVPIDPEYPQDRIDYIEKDTKCKMCIDENELRKFKESQADYSEQNPASLTKADHLAYVIYTSGTTGQPKGVMVANSNVTNIYHGWVEKYELDKIEINLLQMASMSFDVFMGDICRSILTGGKAIVCPSEIRLNPEALYNFIVKHEISIVEGTPAIILPLMDYVVLHGKAMDFLKIVIFGSDTLNIISYRALQKKFNGHIKIINSYGTTETTIDSSYYEEKVETDTVGSITPIGKPFPNINVSILDSKKQLLPIGIVGELFIGGAGLAKGYLNQESLTEEKFISNPFKAGERLYRTGDLARWLPDGNIEFLGRKDSQVKISGYRIELGEIEYALQCHDEIEEAIVLVKENQNNEKELVAYIISKAQQNINELRSYLKESLPAYMLPAYYVQLETLPLTSNGKIDKKSLPDPQGLGLASGVEYIAPRNELEQDLVKIWENILQREHIGIKNDFFELGGHSLKAVRLSNEYQKALSVKLSLKDLFIHTSIASHAELIRSSKKSEFNQIEKVALQESYPLSDAQRRLWVLSQFEDGSVAYNMPGSVKLEGKYELSVFQRSFDRLMDRHEILRTVFREDGSGEARQWILKTEALGFKIDYKDYRKEQNKEEKIQEYIAADSYKTFDLEQGPLLRAVLLQLGDECYVFYFNMHHIISDGWSMEVLIRDVLTLHDAYKENQEADPMAIGLKELRIQYKDYSAWALAQLKEESFKAHRAYWLERLGGELPLIDLPSTKQRPRIKSSNGQALSTYIDAHTSSKLKNYSEANGGSLFMGLLASWNILMYRYTSQKDIIIGTPVAGRDHGDLEDQIGFYVNTLALRNEINGEEDFNGFFSSLKNNTLKSYSHQMYPFDRLVEELDLQRATSRSAVFDVMLTFQHAGEKTQRLDPMTIGSATIGLNQITDRGFSASKFDLELIVQDTEDHLTLDIVYNTDVYERTMIEGLIRHYKQLLNALLDNPGEKISQLDYLSQKEKYEILVTFNDTKVAYPKEKTIIDLFEEQVAKTPNNIALVFEEKELTYRELDEQSNQLADYLQQHYQLLPDDLVGVMQERSEWMLISVLAILKAGGAYVPIDPAFPQERIDYIKKDTNCKVCIDEKELRKFRKGQKKYSKEKTASLVKSGDLIYVIYTSGSTGNPKGVLLEYSGVVNRLLWMGRDLKISEKDVFVQKTPTTFDVSVWELFLPLISGSKLVIAIPDGHKDPVYLENLIKDFNISIIHFVPSMLSGMLENIQWAKLKSLRHVICSGEALPKKSEELFKARSPLSKLHNYYGPTEASVDVTAIDLTQFPTLGSEVSIGKPVDNTSIYIVNQMNKLQPIGVLGEILIGGDQVARGYLNKKSLTEEKFISNPFKEGERLYRTGDLGRWLPDGNIEYIGRKDDQVKIRGYRIELGEIENALQSYKEITATVVLVKKNQNNEKELVAYVTATTQQNISELRAYLKKILPEYMLPAYYVQLETLPLTSNGKIDKKSLPDPKGLGLASGAEYVAPGNELEEKLVKIWEKVLQREHIGVKDDFFVLGGHSLKALRLSNEYQRDLSVKLSLKDLFIHTSIASHAELIRSSKKSEFNQIEKVALQESYPLSDAQRRLWVLSQFKDGSVAYNMPGSVKLEGKYELSLFQRAFDSLIERHEILRTVFREDGTGEVRQWIVEKEALSFQIDYKDYRKEQNKAEKIKEYIATDSYRPFDLEQGPLLRASLLHAADACYVFYFNVHHIISDGWSMEVLTRDVLALHDAYKENREPALKELRIQYKDYSAWALAQLEEEAFKAHRAYWLERLGGELSPIDLPSTKRRPRIKSSNGQALSTYIAASTSSKLKSYSEVNGGSLFMGLLASWSILMYRYTSQKDIIIGTPVAGRDHGDLEDQIGFYVNTLALRNEINAEESFNEYYSTLKASTLKSYDHQLYPFDRLVEELNIQRDTSRSAVFDVLLTLQNNGEKLEAIELKEEALTQIIDKGFSASKFDLELSIQEIGDYLSLEVVYNTDVYERTMIEGLIRHYKQLLKALLENPEQRISQIDYLSQWEKHELQISFNDTKAAYPKEKTIIDLFEEQVSKTPDSIALIVEDKEVTYRELDDQSNQLAYYLQKNYSIQGDDLIGILLERTEWMIISILGVLKSGGAYVPIDPEYPQERIDYIQKDTDCKVCIDENELRKFEKSKTTYSKEKINFKIKADDLAYVIYTSGSTGNPKGVMISHGNANSFIHWSIEEFKESDFDVVFGVTSICFDLSVFEIFYSLSVGKPLRLLKDGLSIPDYLNSSSRVLLNTVPSIVGNLLSHGIDWSSVGVLNMAGEPIPDRYLQELPFEQMEVRNLYGPSEDTTYSTVYRLSPDSGILIGHPISNTEIYIVNESDGLQGIGVAGEICISGDGLARGYWNKAELTAERFVANPFRKNSRMYRTGDIGRWLPNGNIEFFGRRDDQVKIRGYRIELKEIENTLLLYPGMRSAVVMAVKNAMGEKELSGYLVSDEELTISELRQYLRKLLPVYMLPDHYIQLSELPLTPSGKIDKKALLAMSISGMKTGKEYVAPRNEIEIRLAEIFTEILGIENIAIQDSFFDLGGNSFKVIHLFKRISEVYPNLIQVGQIYSDPTIAGISAIIKPEQEVISNKVFQVDF